MQWLPHRRAQALGLVVSVVAHRRLSGCGAWFFRHARHVGSSWTRDPIRVPYIGRQILNHWTTREVLFSFLLEIYLLVDLLDDIFYSVFIFIYLFGCMAYRILVL